MLYSHANYTHIYVETYRWHNKDERTQFFRKIYLSLYSKGLLCERWVGDWIELQHIDPHQLFWLKQHFFPVLLGCSTGGLVLIPASSLQLIWLLVAPGLHNYLKSTYFLRASQFTLNSTRRQSRLSPDIFDRMHLLFKQVYFSSDSPAGSEVNM